ncbi:IS1634 family transposase [Marinilabilia salmonicolor]|uniref:IS4 family transposase n=1 Tax=Marinilabilia salmonicolor TaxID=989 RepID=A0A368VH68_9BACT|nr:IS1634 family transposase [Marinilabilia salmonicolor]RCW38351.1 IS4 family transposase [Marinilabilia salmonicolor]
MFIRKKRNKSGTTSVQIIQKVKRSNKILKTIGSSSNPSEIEKLYQKALYEMPRLYGATLFDSPPQPVISDLSNDSIRVCGPDIIFGRIYDHVGYCQVQETLLKDLVISRITHPGSKLNLAKYLNLTGKRNVSVYSIYRFLDKLNNQFKKRVEDISFDYTKKILGGRIGVVFYDMTTIYFEASELDDFRIAGFSKEGKHQNPQIMLGLLVGKDGYPIGYELFEGNSFEGNTLIPVLEKYTTRFHLKKPIVIADSGLLSKSNIEQLSENGYGFIIGARIKNEARPIKDKILALELADGQLACVDKGNGLSLHIGYSAKRAKKDKFNRERGLAKLEKRLASGKLTKANINNRGYNKFLKLDGQITVSIDQEKLNTDQKWDGLKGYLTNTNLSSKEVILNYNNLWKIEKAFRISKTDLRIRPIFHRLKKRIESHICISFMAYLIYKELERVLQESDYEISMATAIENINKMYEVVTDNNQFIRLKNTLIQQQILDIVKSSF